MKRITHIKCIEPFIDFRIHDNGYLYSCCPCWSKVGHVGRLLHRNAIMNNWNSDKMQFIRKNVLENKLEKICSFKYCPNAIRNEYINLEAIKNDDPKFNAIIDQIMEARTSLDTYPYIFEIANSGKCTLDCIMCPSKHTYTENEELLDQKLFIEILPELLPHISRLLLSGNGDVFFNPYSRHFLQSLNPDHYPSLRLRLFTNGILFNRKLWESIRQNRYESIIVSIDAASKETYEKIRKKGNWDIVMQNLDFISELRRLNIFHFFGLCFCVMKSNYKEMKDFAELGARLGCDVVLYQKIYGRLRENINLTANEKVLNEIAQILMDPVFKRNNVDTRLIDDYRAYLNKPVDQWSRVVTTLKELSLR